MAYLTINSTFTPYSFDELIKPFAMYDTAYREQEAYLDAARELDNSGGMFNQESTPIAYGMYSTANDSLKAISDELATNGLSSDLKSRLRNTVRDYRSTMKTLNSAQERYYAEQDRRAKLGSDYVFQQENLSVDDFLGGKSPNQRGESLTNITKDIATQFSARAQQITNDTWNKVLGNNGNVIGGYYDVTTESGLTAAQLDTILADEDTWNSIMKNSGISNEQKGLLQSFRNTITAKKNSIGYNDYDDYSRSKIDEAIIIGAHGALGGTTHKYEADKSYNPLGWAQLDFQKQQYADNLLAAEAPYTHSDEDNPTPGNRTGLKEGYSIKNGKLQYNAGGTGTESKKGTEYTTTTPGVDVYTPGAKKWLVLKGDQIQHFDKLSDAGISASPIAIEDITDPDILRVILNRINVSTANISDSDLPLLVYENLPELNQLTVRIGGTKGKSDYVWAVEDKKIQRLTGDSNSVSDDDDRGIGL